MKNILLAVLCAYALAMLIPYIVATYRGIRDGKIGFIKAIAIFPFGLLAFLIVMPIGVIIGILKIRKSHV